MELKFKNKNFRIMQIADTQDTNRTSRDTIEFIRMAIKKAKPNLIVFSGDQVKGYGFNLLLGDRKENVKKCIDNLIEPIDETNIPFTYVYGNHDDTSFSIPKEEQFEIYKAHRNCIAFNADDNIDGYCNQNFSVKGEDGKTKLNLFLIDSLSMDSMGNCEHVHENQLNWYRTVRDRMQKENGGVCIPSFVFQHIPVPEIYELLKAVPKGTEGSAKGYRQYAGKYYYLNDENTIIDNKSFIGETPSIPVENGGEFDVLCEKGDVFGLFFGHDHNNSFVGEYKGIKMGYTQGCGFNVYGPGLDRGVRIFDFPEDNPRDFKTTTITTKDIPEFKVKNKIKYDIYTYAPSSMDSVKPYIKGAIATAIVGGAIGIVCKFLIK